MSVCLFGRSFVHLDNRLFVWTIVCSFGRSFVRLDDHLFLWTLFVSLDNRLDVVSSFGRSFVHLGDHLFVVWAMFRNNTTRFFHFGDVWKQCEAFLSLWQTM